MGRELESKFFGGDCVIADVIWLTIKMCDSTTWLDAMRETVKSYRRMIDATIAQLTDAELHSRPTEDFNSVAIILRHLGGNLQSRWTDFLTTDGEKPDRNRDAEFLDWDGDRQSLMEYFERGWSALVNAIESIDAENVGQTILIRGEPHTIAQALTRSVTHLTYHGGQIVMIARMVHDGEWRWLTIAPGLSGDHNNRTWGTKASRSVFSDEEHAK
jgi:uncharacterized damage-inducible protein DinB